MPANPSSGSFLALALALAVAAFAVTSCVSDSSRSQAAPAMAAPAIKPASAMATTGRSLFLKNCAHCHADDATGDEGPNLHGLRHSDDWIARRIRNGVKGEMTAFGGKFNQDDIDAIIAFLRTLQ